MQLREGVQMELLRTCHQTAREPNKDAGFGVAGSHPLQADGRSVGRAQHQDDQAPVFSDVGPLIILGRAGHRWLLRDLFG